MAKNTKKGKFLTFRGFDGTFTPEDCCEDGGIPKAGVLLLAGGIGITPMRAMLPHFVDEGVPVTPLYGVRHCEDAAFLDEFAQVGRLMPMVTLIAQDPSDFCSRPS